MRSEIRAAWTPSENETKGAANKIELDLSATMGESILGGRFSVSTDTPGKIIWQSAGDSYEIGVALAKL